MKKYTSAALVAAAFAVTAGEAGAQSRETYRITVPAPNEAFGSALAQLDDFDGDGISEFAVGAPDAGTDPAGRVYVYRGSDGSLIRTHDGLDQGPFVHSSFGWSIARLDDLDGDGIGEYAILEPEDERIEFHSGGDGSLVRQIQLDGLPGTKAGCGLVSIGDLDGDGVRDLICQQPGVDAAHGRIDAISCASGAVLWELYGENFKDYFGWQVLPLGDVDADGVEDLLVSAPKAPKLSSYGTLYLYSSKTRALLWRVDGVDHLGSLGYALASAGDANSDGVADFLATHDDYYNNLRRTCELRSGADGSLLGEYAPSDPLESVVKDYGALADVDGDGDPDCVLPGAYSTSPYGPWYGELFVWNPRTQTQLARSVIEYGTSQVGAVVPLGDVDGDSFADFAYVQPEQDLVVLTFRSSPAVTDVTPARGRYDADTPITVKGGGFTLAQHLVVDLGGRIATDVVVVDDATLTCTVPHGITGPIDVTVSDDAGSATLASGFARTPAVELDGAFTIGGSFTARYLCDPGDTLFAIAGAPPAVSIHVAPFDFDLEIAPFLILFIQTNVGADEFDLPVTIPNDPALSGAQVLFQALAGPRLGGKGKSGAWTNAAQLQIQ